MDERRTGGDRRSGLERRSHARTHADRRLGRDRRAIAAATLAAATLIAAAPAEAQIYTRKNAKGVVEATNIPADRSYRLTYPGKGRLIHSQAYRLRRSYNGEYDAYIVDAAATHNVHVDLVRAIIQVESDYDHLAVSSKGAQGLMQLMPETARRFGVADPFDPRSNINGGVRYLRVLLDLFGGDIELASAAYNAGENAVLRYNGVPPYRETRNYVQKVAGLLGSVATPLTTMASYVPGTALLEGKQNATAEAPRPSLGAASAKKTAAARPARPRPRTFYRWTDEKGIVHVGNNPPTAGVSYSTIRAVD
jgi:soluble lytic murein transglycosylase-like protein